MRFPYMPLTAACRPGYTSLVFSQRSALGAAVGLSDRVEEVVLLHRIWLEAIGSKWYPSAAVLYVCGRYSDQANEDHAASARHDPELTLF